MLAVLLLAASGSYNGAAHKGPSLVCALPPREVLGKSGAVLTAPPPLSPLPQNPKFQNEYMHSITEVHFKLLLVSISHKK